MNTAGFLPKFRMILAKAIIGTADICTDVNHEHHSSWGCLEVNIGSAKREQKFLMGWGNTLEYYLAIQMNDRTL